MEGILRRLQLLRMGMGAYCFWLFLGAMMFLWPLEKRGKWGLRALACALGFVLLGAVLPIFRFGRGSAVTIAWYIAALAVVCLLCPVICRISPAEAVYCGINGMFLAQMGSCAQVLLTAWLFQGSMKHMNAVHIPADLAVYLPFWLLVGRRMLHRGGHIQLDKGSFAVVGAIGILVTVVLNVRFKADIDPSDSFVLQDERTIRLLCAGQLFVMAFCAAILALEYSWQKELAGAQRLAESHEQWALRQKQYELSRENIEMINRRCHDMKHQIAALMATRGVDEKLAGYRREIEDLIEVYDLEVHTDNEALNTLLMEKGLYCRNLGIRWHCAVDGESLSFMEPMDLYVMLGNALDNAIEAVQKIPEPEDRLIQLQIGRRGRFSHIRLENSCASTPQWRGRLPETTKADAASHGIGLKSLCAIAEKWGGSAKVSAEDEVFILTIVIPIP